ncbi:rhamnogalacturonan acetylesterase [Segetibacter sp. 3557_3]|uniref:rhamnogalacturonan acetylesterase n=1 Tax=Segetibacter sp. 3557_3 TaxID=2547429 RepID=UPI001058767C|nr:rhamnogalacturonan acetylesterase [Segetibacter sp. 3557_3]TDH26464.1 rhamnogalacturonan acetylesterase [Segetibacter sp. 3557_3]
MRYILNSFLLALVMVFLAAFADIQRPVLYIIGDSTVRNSNQEQWGWGTMLPNYFDTNRITIANHAMAGRSSRTFTNERRWARVDSLLKAGDFVMMQFGHNDGSYPDTSARNRGTLKGTGDETIELVYRDGRKETVHTYGWYIRQFVRNAKAKKATPIVLSMIPRNEFREGKLLRATNDFGKWAREVAEQEGVPFIDLNAITADKYDRMGADSVKAFFPGDHTHTNKAGAELNAQSVADGIKMQPKLALNQYLRRS